MKYIPFIFITSLILAACGTPAEIPTPTPDYILAAYTSAAQTVQAGPLPVFTPMPVTAPLATSTSAIFTPSLLIPPTFTVVPATPTCQDRAQFIGGGSDQKYYKPGERFAITWTLKNAGNCTWDKYYDLVFAGQGDKLGAPDSIAFIVPGQTIPPEGTIDITVSFSAPSAGGVYQSLWNLVDGYGSMIPIQNGFTDSALYVEIEVSNQGGGEKVTGRVVNMQFISLELVDGVQCNVDAVYLLVFQATANGPVTIPVQFVAQISGFETWNGFLSVESETIVFTGAGVQAYTLDVSGPYDDPEHITVSAVVDGRVYTSYTIPCP